MSKEPTEKAQFLLDAVERRIFEDGYEGLRKLLCAMIRHRELRSLAEEIIQTEQLTQGWTRPLCCVCLDKSFVMYMLWCTTVKEETSFLILPCFLNALLD